MDDPKTATVSLSTPHRPSPHAPPRRAHCNTTCEPPARCSRSRRLPMSFNANCTLYGKVIALIGWSLGRQSRGLLGDCVHRALPSSNSGSLLIALHYRGCNCERLKATVCSISLCKLKSIYFSPGSLTSSQSFLCMSFHSLGSNQPMKFLSPKPPIQ